METFSALLAICAGNSPVPCELPAQRPVTRSFDVSLICVWINGWVNSREAGDLRRYRTHYDVIVMPTASFHKGPVMQSCIFFFVFRLNKQFNKRQIVDGCDVYVTTL